MIFDQARRDHGSVIACAPQGPHLSRTAAERLRHPAETVKRKSLGRSLLVYPPAYSALCPVILPHAERGELSGLARRVPLWHHHFH
jgi:hypothetical protein